ncbi:GRIP and coiled-coil domain-containing protein 2-like [Oppia nitens]|uniref:GRIP and coiled-coil domain-containing protein 2-like n=1 Tax=Oppia nitens TaxID=1686743 RepID=UPI0023DAFF86|nr:GRIP and coiled-coil domain-containing protein 2-like [Oppia nitens]
MESNTNLVNGLNHSNHKTFNDQSLNNEDNNDINELNTRLTQTEDKLTKFKTLAVKLKKELNETKEQLSKSISDCNELKCQLKGHEKEKTSQSYQQLFRNFQGLQTEYDKIQDESDSLNLKNKELERDLNNAITQLTTTREELAESKQDIESYKSNINSLKEEIQSLEAKKREFESKIIVLENDLDLERKRNVANTGLGQTISELRHQLDEKTTEIIDLSDKLENSSHESKMFEQISSDRDRLLSRVENLEKDNKFLNEDINKYKETLETQLSELEDYKIKCCQWTAQMQTLQLQSNTNSETYSITVKNLETKVNDLQQHISDLEVDLKDKDHKFEEYKHRVCKVLKQQNDVQTNEVNTQYMQELKTQIDDLTQQLNTIRDQLDVTLREKESLEKTLSQLNSSHNLLKNQMIEYNTLKERLNEYKTNNEKLKSLSRELQLTLVNDRKESQLKHKKELTDLEDNNNKNIISLETQLNDMKNEVKELKHEMNRYSHQTSIQSIESSNKLQQSLTNLDDLDSIETISISEKKASTSPTSIVSNVLQDILYNNESQEFNHSNQDFTKHLTFAQNKVEKLTQLLEDSESNNILISEQNRVLKEEIRRLERSIERTEVANNLEYLKNVVVKFITLNGEQERQRLIPVLATILKLSPEEQNLFQTFTSVDPNSSSSNSRWTDYLYHWNSDPKL